MRLITYMRKRCVDWRRERRIHELRRAMTAACMLANVCKSLRLFNQMRDEIAQRSPEQVARMERERGLAARTKIKKYLVPAYCRGWLPAWLVRAAFKAFRLRNL